MGSLNILSTRARPTRLFGAFFLTLTLASGGQAVTVTNLSSGAVAFETDFESGLSTMTPSSGTWTRIGPSVVATDSSTLPDPGPAEGADYARFFRNSNTSGQGDLVGTLGTVQSGAGDAVRLSFMLYIPSDSEGVLYRATAALADGDFTNFRARVLTDGAGNVLVDGPGFARYDSGIDYIPDTWQRWELTYEVGSTTFSVRVGDSVAAGFTSPTIGQVSTVVFNNGSQVPGTFYMDAVPVPEPATYGLLLAGLALVGAVTARHRRHAEGRGS